MCAQHPEWFKHRPDGSVQYAENPPKKYQDIYPFDFESARLARPVERTEERDRVLGGAGRADLSRRQSAHQAFAFWEWCIGEIKRAASGRDLPGRGVHAAEGHAPAGEARVHAVLYLFHLAQHQARADRIFHRTDAAAGAEYFRPNVWPNTPDILHEYAAIGPAQRVIGSV